MSQALIQKHNFEIAKGNIERFSRNLPSNPSFNRVEVDGGLFGWGDHKVTGTEMNKFIGVVQDKLISVNSSLRAIMGEFKEVYNAFDFLDGEYISGIIGSVESAEEASKQALKAQEDIKATVEKLKKTVVGLVNLKQNVERIEGIIKTSNISSYNDIVNELDSDYKIKHIPSFVNTLSTLQNSLVGFEQQVKGLTQKTNQAVEHINEKIVELQQYRSILESYEHLGDVDTVWRDVEEHKANLTGLHHQVEGLIEKTDQAVEHINERIVELQQYRSILESYEHLGDVDTVWRDVEEHKANLTGLHHQVEGLIEKTDQAVEHINERIVELQQYRSILESYEHLGDVDTVWHDVEEHKANLTDLHHQVEGLIEKTDQAVEHINGKIVALQQYRSILESYEHLGDVDTIWNDVEEQKTNLASLHQQIVAFIEEVRASENEIKDTLQKISKDNDFAHLQIEKRIKIAYCIGGSALGLIVLNFILQLLGIL